MNRPVLAMHRLLTIFEVDDGETGMSEADGTVFRDPGTGGVRAAVVEEYDGRRELGLKEEHGGGEQWILGTIEPSVINENRGAESRTKVKREGRTSRAALASGEASKQAVIPHIFDTRQRYGLGLLCGGLYLEGCGEFRRVSRLSGEGNGCKRRI